MTDYYDRIVFAHDPGRDFVMVGSSLSDVERRKWENKLRAHVVVDHGRQPPRSMWYWADGYDAAVLWRMADGGDGRSSRCHGLVCTNGEIDPDIALALANWRHWEDEEWSPSADGVLNRRRGIRKDEFDVLARGQAFQSDPIYLTAIVRAVIREPDKPVSIVTDSTGMKTKMYLLRDMMSILQTLFGIEGLWTFSTFEARHDDGVNQLPRFIFLPEDIVVNRMHPVSRSFVHLPPTGVLDNDVYQLAAEELVDRYFQQGWEKLGIWLKERNVIASADPRARVRELLVALGLAGPIPVPQATAPVPEPAVPRVGDVELVQRLRHATPGSHRPLLDEIKARCRATHGERPKVRQLLLEGSRWLESTYASFGPDQLSAAAAVRVLVDFAVDDAEWRDIAILDELNAAIADPATTAVLENALVSRAISLGTLRSLEPGLAIRHVRQRGFVVPDPEQRAPVPAANPQPAPQAPLPPKLVPRQPVVSARQRSAGHLLERVERVPIPIWIVLLVTALAVVILVVARV